MSNITFDIKNFIRNETSKIENVLHYAAGISPYNMIHSVFRITIGEKMTTICHLISRLNNERKFTHNYVTFSPTFLSMDGEYRSNFLHYDNFDKMIGSLNAEENEPFLTLQSLLSQLLANGDIVIHSRHYYPDQFVYQEEFVSSIKNSTLELDLLTYFIYSANRDIKYKKLQSHNELSSIGVMEELRKNKQIMKTLDQLHIRTNMFFSSHPIGMKIIPLLDEYDNNHYQTKLEMYYTNLASKLRIDGRGSGFSIYGGWYIIYNCDELLFDNYNVRKRFEMKKRVEKIKDIRYLDCMKRENDFSGKAIVMIMEDVGITFANVIDKYITEPMYKKNMTRTYLRTLFLRTICMILNMHHYYGLYHLDLHANNIVVRVTDIDKKQHSDKKLSVINLLDTPLLFNHIRSEPYIIDWSRSVRLNEEIIKDAPPIFMLTMKNRMKLHLKNRYPDYYIDNVHIFDDFIEKNPIEMARILGYSDIYDICNVFKGLVNLPETVMDPDAVVVLKNLDKYVNNIMLKVKDYMSLTLQKIIAKLPFDHVDPKDVILEQLVSTHGYGSKRINDLLQKSPDGKCEIIEQIPIPQPNREKSVYKMFYDKLDKYPEFKQELLYIRETYGRVPLYDSVLFI